MVPPLFRGGRGRSGWAAGSGPWCWGGATARAVAVELATAGVAGLTIVNRTEARAAELAALLAEKFNLRCPPCMERRYAVPPDADLLSMHDWRHAPTSRALVARASRRVARGRSHCRQARRWLLRRRNRRSMPRRTPQLNFSASSAANSAARPQCG